MPMCHKGVIFLNAPNSVIWPGSAGPNGGAQYRSSMGKGWKWSLKDFWVMTLTS